MRPHLQNNDNNHNKYNNNYDNDYYNCYNYCQDGQLSTAYIYWKAAGPVDSGASCRQGQQGGCRQGCLILISVFLISVWEGRPCRQGPVGCRNPVC